MVRLVGSEREVRFYSEIMVQPGSDLRILFSMIRLLKKLDFIFSSIYLYISFMHMLSLDAIDTVHIV